MTEPHINDPEIIKTINSYEALLEILLLTKLAPFLQQVDMETNMGWRRGFQDSEDGLLVTSEILAKRSNVTGHPLFASEVDTFRDILRFLCKYPQETVKGIIWEDVPIIEQLTRFELLAICVWLEHQTKGAGLSLFAGPIINR